MQTETLDRAIDRLQSEKDGRVKTTGSLKSFSYSYAPTGDPRQPAVAAPGTVTVYLAREGSKYLSAVRKAAEADKPMDPELFDTLRAQYRQRRAVSLSEAVEYLSAQDDLIDLTYDGVTLFGDLTIPEDLDLVIIQFPYAGGELLPGAFAYDKYTAAKSSGLDLEGIAVINEAPLSRAEAAALAKLGSRNERLKFGDTSPISWCPAVAVVAVVATVGFLCFHAKQPELHLPIQRLNILTPELTAIELLEIRQKILAGVLV